MELLGPILDKAIKEHKKWILSLVSFVVGLTLSPTLELGILRSLGITCFTGVDVILTALFLTGGTKGVNDLVKLIGYKKEEVKTGLNEAQIAQV